MDLSGLDSVLLFAAIGFFAQLCDGALGMGFGVISYSVLTAMGLDPKTVSATVNGAKIFTGLASGAAHIHQRNVNWRLAAALLAGGAVGASIGVLLLLRVSGETIQIIIAAYLIAVGTLIGARALRMALPIERRPRAAVVGMAGGMLEAIAGIWGPLVTSSLVLRGLPPRFVVGSVNLAETAIAVCVSVLLASQIGFASVTTAVLGLVGGAIIAAPLAARFTRTLPARTLMLGIAGLMIITSLLRIARLLLD